MSPNDALDPGPDGDFPNVPRLPDGTVDPVRFPTGPLRQKPPGGGPRVLIDQTPRHPDGTPIVPPTP